MCHILQNKGYINFLLSEFLQFFSIPRPRIELSFDKILNVKDFLSFLSFPIKHVLTKTTHSQNFKHTRYCGNVSIISW